MKALTICQPWAELILRGDKRIENRKWPTSYRGQLLIHAGKSRDWLETCDTLPADFDEDALDFGAIVGKVELLDCLPKSKVESMIRFGMGREWAWIPGHVYAEGPVYWVLGRVWRLAKPIPWKGALGLFTVADGQLAAHKARWVAV
jgi:hypothetical protein